MAEYKTEVNQDMRRIYREHTKHMSDDASILLWWNRQVDRANETKQTK